MIPQTKKIRLKCDLSNAMLLSAAVSLCSNPFKAGGLKRITGVLKTSTSLSKKPHAS